MTFLTCEPRVSSRSHGQADTCIDLMFSSNIDATLAVFDESDVLAWPKVPVGPLNLGCVYARLKGEKIQPDHLCAGRNSGRSRRWRQPQQRDRVFEMDRVL